MVILLPDFLLSFTFVYSSDSLQSTRVSCGLPTEMQLGLQSPLYLRKLSERMGTTYINLDLFIASAPTYSPPEYVEDFQNSFNRAPPVPFEEVHKILQQELGRPTDSVYEIC